MEQKIFSFPNIRWECIIQPINGLLRYYDLWKIENGIDLGNLAKFNLKKKKEIFFLMTRALKLNLFGIISINMQILPSK